MKYQVTLSTIASITVTLDAENEDTALDQAHDAAREFSGQYHAGHNWVGDLNDEWQYEEPEIKEVS